MSTGNETTAEYTIHPIRDSKDVEATKALFTAYATSLQIDLSFQDFATELANLPGKYTLENGGHLLLAKTRDGTPVGCVALRSWSAAEVADDDDDNEKNDDDDDDNDDATTNPKESSTTSTHLDSNSDGVLPEVKVDVEVSEHKTAELKRLYIHPQARGSGLGKMLTLRILEVAESLGYREIRLDTLPTMVVAQKMYQDLGFREIDAYRHNPVEGTRYLALRLTGTKV